MVDSYDFYEEMFAQYKDFIENNSIYKPSVVKYNNNMASKFPTIVFYMSNNTNTDNGTVDRIEKYEAIYFTINIYTKDKTKGTSIVTTSQVINNELSKLTTQFFGNIIGMKKTLDSPQPNLDTSILRKVIQYQCLRGNAKGDIIRR
jgi:hypothetical protein